MSKIVFREMQVSESMEILPQLFRILYTNMTRIAPTGCNYEEDQKIWLDYIVPAVHEGKLHIVLMYAGDTLAGYTQFSAENDTLMVDEVEICPEYQRTFVFYRFCQYMMNNLPHNVGWFASYVRKDNANSISIHEALGMERIGENKSGTSWHYRGEIGKAAARFRGK